MEEMESFQAKRLIKVFNGPFNSILIGKIISRFKRMSRVKTDPHSFLVMNSVDDFFDLIKRMADLCPLACCVLQEENDSVLHLFKGPVDPQGNCLNGLIF